MLHLTRSSLASPQSAHLVDVASMSPAPSVTDYNRFGQDCEVALITIRIPHRGKLVQNQALVAFEQSGAHVFRKRIVDPEEWRKMRSLPGVQHRPILVVMEAPHGADAQGVYNAISPEGTAEIAEDVVLGVDGLRDQSRQGRLRMPQDGSPG